LTKNDPIPKLQLLSVVGTSSELSHQWFEKIETSCPVLSDVFFTRKKGTKALGWQDVIMLQTMRKPQLLPCGHIGDKESSLRSGFCSLDRKHFMEEELIAVDPLISHLQKQPDPLNPGKTRWVVQIVDQLRQPLGDKCYYHPECGTFYNAPTLRKLFESAKPEDLSPFMEQLKNDLCVQCNLKLWTLRICFPHPALPEDQHNFPNLAKMGGYTIEGIARVKIDDDDH